LTKNTRAKKQKHTPKWRIKKQILMAIKIFVLTLRHLAKVHNPRASGYGKTWQREPIANRQSSMVLVEVGMKKR